MATNIQASTTSGLLITPDQSGVLTLQSGSNTATMPAATGTVMVSGNMPAFSAYANTGTVLANSTSTKIIFDAKEYDTNNNYSTVNSRFTPTVAGYYTFIANIYWGSGSRSAETSITFYKNGSLYKAGIDTYGTTTSFYLSQSSCMMYLNGTTDYFEVYAYAATGATTNTGLQYSWLQGAMIRSA